MNRKIYDMWNKPEQNGVFQDAIRELREIPQEHLYAVYRFGVQLQTQLLKLKTEEQHGVPALP